MVSFYLYSYPFRVLSLFVLYLILSDTFNMLRFRENGHVGNDKILHKVSLWIVYVFNHSFRCPGIPNPFFSSPKILRVYLISQVVPPKLQAGHRRGAGA